MQADTEHKKLHSKKILAIKLYLKGPIIAKKHLSNIAYKLPYPLCFLKYLYRINPKLKIMNQFFCFNILFCSRGRTGCISIRIYDPETKNCNLTKKKLRVF